MLRGRVFTDDEGQTRSGVAVINVSMACRFFTSEADADADADADGSHLPALVDGRLAGARELGTLDPVGQRFRLTDDPSGAWFTVIGVVADVMIEGVGDREVTPAACVTYP